MKEIHQHPAASLFGIHPLLYSRGIDAGVNAATLVLIQDLVSVPPLSITGQNNTPAPIH